jgi:arylsulfatase A-like enzyme
VLPALLVTGLVLSGCSSEREARDVLLVTLDTTRADHLGCYGDDDAHTPNLDALAAEAVLFEQAMAPVAVTLPSHSTMLTGLDPPRHGVRYNLMYVLPESQRSAAEDLADAGFATGAVVSAPVINAHFGLAQGFGTYTDVSDMPPGATPSDSPERKAGDTVELALQWWRDHAGERRFLWVHFYDPHWPYRPPFPWSARFEGREYAGEIAYTDEQVGKLFAHLREAGDWEDALVVVAGDHGEGLYEHGERWHAELVYQSTLRAPLIVKPPRHRGARRIAEPVGLTDVGPTLLDFAGLEPPAEIDGISLRDAVRTGEAPERALYFESIVANLNYGWAAQAGVRIGDYKYFEGARPELYDLSTDPDEQLDLAASDRDLAQQMAAELAALRDRDGSMPEADATRVLDEEKLRQLNALGYVGNSASEPSDIADALHPPDQVELLQELLRIQTMVGGGQWEEATEALDFVLAKDPKNRSALHNRIWAHIAADELDEALLKARSMAVIYPESHRPPDLVAQVLSRLGRPGEAADVLAKALEQHEDHPSLRYHRFLALMEAGRTDEARVELELLETQRPDDFTTPVSRAMLEAASGRIDASIEALERAVELGLRNLGPVEASPLFEAVRADPRYSALVERAKAAKPAESAENLGSATQSLLAGFRS